MGKMTNEMVERSFDIAKLRYEKKISLREGVIQLEQVGVNTNSAPGYIYCYAHLLRGERFTRRINSFATEYYLQRILEENGLHGLSRALDSFSKHYDYLETLPNIRVKKGREILQKYLRILQTGNDIIFYPDEFDSKDDLLEGKFKKILINAYERNSAARQKCIDHFGYTCKVCDMNFIEKYGLIGEGFIHVHHKLDISKIKKEYKVNPITDLVPVCPNCHAMLHKRKPAYSIEELKQIINREIYH